VGTSQVAKQANMREAVHPHMRGDIAVPQ